MSEECQICQSERDHTLRIINLHFVAVRYSDMERDPACSSSRRAVAFEKAYHVEHQLAADVGEGQHVEASADNVAKVRVAADNAFAGGDMKTVRRTSADDRGHQLTTCAAAGHLAAVQAHRDGAAQRAQLLQALPRLPERAQVRARAVGPVVVAAGEPQVQAGHVAARQAAADAGSVRRGVVRLPAPGGVRGCGARKEGERIIIMKERSSRTKRI
ncbi:unnamed protein product [Phytophthora lilii]|uniref:Unnamed protein product n=1 Tax=Phytophthora lilii TaxID=2077276 RepID=A0A9W6XFC6_9STRA|nr:unnamed protein product [Phytophthora lilii]